MTTQITVTLTAHGWAWGIMLVGVLVHVVAHISLLRKALK